VYVREFQGTGGNRVISALEGIKAKMLHYLTVLFLMRTRTMVILGRPDQSDIPEQAGDEQGNEESAGGGEEEDIRGEIATRSQFAMLDPDDSRLAFASRMFAKMGLKRIHCPTGFRDEKLHRKEFSKRPFHEGIFSEIFEK
jgi:hypothetical protein